MNKNHYTSSKRYKNTVHIHDPIFEQSYWVFNCKTAIDFKREYQRIIPETQMLDIDEFQSGKFAVVDFGNKGTIGIIWAKDREHLVHELLHATTWILGKRGVPITQENDEVMAYYQCFLLREIERSSK